MSDPTPRHIELTHEEKVVVGMLQEQVGFGAKGYTKTMLELIERLYVIAQNTPLPDHNPTIAAIRKVPEERSKPKPRPPKAKPQHTKPASLRKPTPLRKR